MSRWGGKGRRVLYEPFDGLGSAHRDFEIQNEKEKKWKEVNY